MDPGARLDETSDDSTAERASASSDNRLSIGEIEHGRELSLERGPAASAQAERQPRVHRVSSSPSCAMGSSTSEALDRTSSLMCVRRIRLQERRPRFCMIVV